jgi:tyrosyl-DNA phosphodiesterase 2
LKLLSWNIEGRHSADLEERIGYICELIMTRKPHVVFLQEVVDQSWGPLIVARLGQIYNCHPSPNPSMNYYNAILIVKEGTSITGDLSMYRFPGSQKGRHLLQLPVQILGVELDVMTTHLETKLERKDERIRQLSEVFGMMNALERSNRMSIFGGDLNLRDTEVISRDDMPEDAVDLWVACGRQREHQYTWDATVNDNLTVRQQPPPSLRFDRIYLNPDDGALRPKSFELVGKDRLSRCGRFPSDHWGIWAEFQVKK